MPGFASRAVRGFIPPSRDRYTKLLLHCDGNNASTTFIDSSPSRHGITATAATLSNAKSHFGGMSGLFASGHLVTTGSAADFNTGQGDYTLDFWSNCTDTASDQGFSMNNAFGSAGHWEFRYNYNGAITAGSLNYFENGTNRISALAAGWSDGNWHHLALVRFNKVVSIYVDGVLKGTPFTTSFAAGDSTSGLSLGTVTGGNNNFTGNLQEIHFSTVARWTAAFLPPAQRYQ